MYKVGMSETDTRRHYYYQPLPDTTPSFVIRVCNWLAANTPVVFMPANIPADCKNCLKHRVDEQDCSLARERQDGRTPLVDSQHRGMILRKEVT